MATTVFSTVVGPGTAASLGGLNDTGYVASTLFLISTDESGAGAFDSIGIRAFSDPNLIVHGHVHGDQWGVVLGEEVGGGTIFVGDTGAINASGFSGIESRPAGQGLAGDVDIVNRGEITTFGYGAFASGTTAAAIYLRSDGVFDALGFLRHDNVIHNSGLISAQGETVDAITIENLGQNTTITNDRAGEIVSTGGAAIGLTGSSVLDSETTDLTGGRVDIENHGLIRGGQSEPGENPVAIDITGFSNDLIVNTGEIFGTIGTGGGNDFVTNRGHITGDVDLGDANDVFDGRGGTMEGESAFYDVLGGRGDDSFYIDSSQQYIFGEAGEDSVYAEGDVNSVFEVEYIELLGRGDFEVFADDTDTIIEGNRGDNFISGGGGNDTIFGRGFHDEIEGGGGADSIRGGAGNDLLTGNAGDDTLLGGVGHDTLVSGPGTDNLRGQRGADTFVWESPSHLDVGGARDAILDWQAGRDIIDVSDININETFDFIGTGAFTGTATEIRYFVLGGIDTVLSFDTDGDGVEDGQILVRNTTTMVADDFIL